jgi:hypothetical protein
MLQSPNEGGMYPVFIELQTSRFGFDFLLLLAFGRPILKQLRK